MRITVIGGGNIGTLMAAELAYRGNEVTVYTSNPQIWSRRIEVYDASNRLLMCGDLTKITGDLADAVAEAEMIWITVPAQMFAEFAPKICPLIRKGQYVGVVPGSGGAEFAFREVTERGGILLGLQRVHSIARVKERGSSVYMLGRKAELKLGAIPAAASGAAAGILERLFDIPCSPLPNYLSVTLTPSNPILHTTRLYTMFKNYRAGMVYERNFLFYEEWDDAASEMLIACDGELQSLCRAIPMDLTAVESLCDYYESRTVGAMTQKIRSIKAFRGITSPMKQVDCGWVPDFDSRYFTADFPYGLKIIKDFAEVYGIKTPNMDKVWDWYTGCTGSADCFRLEADKSAIEEIYAAPSV
ncbi:MAG: NAD/NADP octopine/nopaline dehydrogenase family protein [Lachnospiraceae bacterium]|nr:NAD/NADP octopine/nopaline dehydrogenase family protein [Lachnospiraceae bacterium]